MTATRTAGALRRPALVTVEERVLDETRIELAALRHDAVATADYLEPRLDWMLPVSIELGPAVYQVVLGCLNQVARLRRRATA
jgi:hypothetical protein